MIKNIRLLVEGFFDDEIFNVENNIKTDIEDIGRYYDYTVGDIFYQNKKPYAICCGDNSLFKDNKPRFCLLNDSSISFKWREKNKLVKELGRFKIESFNLKSFNDFKHIDEDGYGNTQIIKNNYDISEFPAFKYCLNLGDNVYLPSIDELLIMYLNKDKLGKCNLRHEYYWSSTLYSTYTTFYISTKYSYVSPLGKIYNFYVYPFYALIK